MVDCFKYLGSKISNDPVDDLSCEISHRISRAADTFRRLNYLWSDRYILRSIKCYLYKVTVLPTLLYGSETWNCLIHHQRRLEVFQMSCLRRIMGISRLDRWRNSDIQDRCRMQPTEALLRHNRLRWLGHVGRMSDDRLPKKVLFGHISGSRAPGRPKARWATVVRQDIQTIPILRYKNIYQILQNREQWRSYISLRK